MNLIARVRLSGHPISSSPTPRWRICSLNGVTALRQRNFYSAYANHKSRQLTNPRLRKSGVSSSGVSQKTTKQKEALATVWPKPKEIQYNGQFANYVKLIGYVAIPVRFEADSNGKSFATTLISVWNGGSRKSLSIPAVFEGELAHVVACHVNKNNCIFISGQLIVDPKQMILSESVGKLYIAVENLNFVKGFENNPADGKSGFSFSIGEIQSPGQQAAKNVVNDDIDINRQVGKEIVNANEKKVSLKGRLGVSPWAKRRGKKKEMDRMLHLWRDLVKNPLQWWDYRGHKTSGLVKENFPDFKQKGTGESLWLENAPEFVLPGLGKLECDVKDSTAKQVQGGVGHSEKTNKKGKNDDFWRNLVENPDKWWDNRTNKRNPKAPDFKHKETGEALWLDSSPVCLWALSVKDSGGTSDGRSMTSS